MAVERELFLEIMASFPSGVGIVATLEGDEPRGLTTTALSSVSADPPLLLVCVDVTSRTLPSLLERRGFVVNFLRSKRFIARHYFGGNIFNVLQTGNLSCTQIWSRSNCVRTKITRRFL